MQAYTARGTVVFLLVAFGAAYALDYTVIIPLLREGSPLLVPVLLARMAAPLLGVAAARQLDPGRPRLSRLAGLTTPSSWALALAMPVLTVIAAYTLSAAAGLLAGLCSPCSPAGGWRGAVLLAFMLLAGALAGVTVNLAAALLEEAGWRGYLYSALRARGVPWHASGALVGLVWGLWHAPLILEGYNYRLPALPGCRQASPGSWHALAAFTLFTLAAGLILALAREASGTVIGAAAGHGTINGVAGVFVLACTGDTLLTPPSGLLVSAAMLALVPLVAVVVRPYWLGEGSSES